MAFFRSIFGSCGVRRNDAFRRRAAGHFKERDRAPQSRGVDRRDASVGSRAFVDHVRWRRRVGASALTPRPKRIPPKRAATKTRLFFSNHKDLALTSPSPPRGHDNGSSRPVPNSLAPTAIRRRRVRPRVRRGVHPRVRRGTRRRRGIGACPFFSSRHPSRVASRREKHPLTFSSLRRYEMVLSVDATAVRRGRARRRGRRCPRWTRRFATRTKRTPPSPARSPSRAAANARPPRFVYRS